MNPNRFHCVRNGPFVFYTQTFEKKVKYRHTRVYFRNIDEHDNYFRKRINTKIVSVMSSKRVYYPPAIIIVLRQKVKSFYDLYK